MNGEQFNHSRIALLGQRVLEGGALNRAEGLWLFNLESSSDIFDLLAWAKSLQNYMRSGNVGDLPTGVRFKGFRHHSEPEWDDHRPEVK